MQKVQPEFRPSRYVVGENIQRFRKENGWSPDTLARKVRMRRNALEEYEAGLRNLSANKLDDFAYALGVKPLDLMEDWSEEE